MRSSRLRAGSRSEYGIQSSLEVEGEPLIAAHESQPPRDAYNLTYVSMLVFGLAALLPWNMFITATSYFERKFEHGSPFVKSQFENFFTIFSQFTNVSFTLLNVYLQQKFSAFARIMSSLSAMFLMFLMTTVLVKIDTDSWADQFFGLTVLSIVFFNAFAGVYAGGIFGLAASFTPRHIQVNNSVILRRYRHVISCEVYYNKEDDYNLDNSGGGNPKKSTPSLK